MRLSLISYITLSASLLLNFACQTQRSALSVSGALQTQSQEAACLVTNLPAQASDPLSRLLRSQTMCPVNVFGLRQLLKQAGGKIQTALVANRGFHNSKNGSFSLFETYQGPLLGQQVGPGSLFFGHFTTANEKTLQHDQTPSQGALMIELISWDAQAGVFRFFELIGDGTQGRWFYRGDSLDIQEDLKTLHLQSNPAKPVFGQRLRCSACHLAGGPILKELAEPHNDWWRAQRRLPFSQQPNSALQENFQTLVDTSVFAQEVKQGMGYLSASSSFQQHQTQRSLPEQLRPLFCPEEVNLASDTVSLDETVMTQLSKAILVDPRLNPQAGDLKVPKADYLKALNDMKAQFPEIKRPDGDHAWLAPVKAAADIQAVQKLVASGLIDQELVSDVLAIDFQRPVYSALRCGLLRTLPATATRGWQKSWADQLKDKPLPGASELLANLTQPERNLASHQQKAQDFLNRCQQRLNQYPLASRNLLSWVGQQRQAIFDSEISKNPRGQIFEPGFRVIFPILILNEPSLTTPSG